MCGRYASARGAADLSALFEAADDTAAEPGDGAAGISASYNIAPTDPAPVVRMSRRRAARVLSVGHWGLLPHWAKDRRMAARMINARAETVATARAYADSFATRRALVPADGWYEWRRDGGVRQAYFLTPRDGSVLALAGLWSRWGPDPGMVTFSVVTTAAVGDLVAVHDRMPLALPPDRWSEWLEGDADPGLSRPAPPRWLAGLEIRPVGPAVGNVREDGPELTKKVDLSGVDNRLF